MSNSSVRWSDISFDYTHNTSISWSIRNAAATGHLVYVKFALEPERRPHTPIQRRTMEGYLKKEENIMSKFEQVGEQVFKDNKAH